MEAISRIKKYRSAQDIKPSFSFRNVNISSALVVQEGDQEIELFTMMYPKKISTASTSGIWYTFSISSFQSGVSVSHCVGRIHVSISSDKRIGSTLVGAADYETWAMGSWYEKLADEGLRFGPTFQTLTSMKIQKEKIRPETLSTCVLHPRIPKSTNSKFLGTFYALHPLVIDACLQAAIMGGTAGHLEKLRALLPIFFENLQMNTRECRTYRVRSLHPFALQYNRLCNQEFNVILRDERAEILMDTTNARLSLSTGRMEDVTKTAELNRHPTLRVIWKPDITRLDPTRKSELDA